MMHEKPFSQACENNKQPILQVLKKAFEHTQQVLEIGSGTGQHAVFLGENLSHLMWQTSDLAINHAGICAWLAEAALPNVHKPIEIDLNKAWPASIQALHIDGVYTANTLHIISWPLVVKFFEGIAKHVALGGKVCIYGPFNYNGHYTSESNEKFDHWLKVRDPNSGIRDIDAIITQAHSAGLKLINDHEMPANNRLLAFTKVSE